MGLYSGLADIEARPLLGRRYDGLLSIHDLCHLLRQMGSKKLCCVCHRESSPVIFDMTGGSCFAGHIELFDNPYCELPDGTEEVRHPCNSVVR